MENTIVMLPNGGLCEFDILPPSYKKAIMNNELLRNGQSK